MPPAHTLRIVATDSKAFQTSLTLLFGNVIVYLLHLPYTRAVPTLPDTRLRLIANLSVIQLACYFQPQSLLEHCACIYFSAFSYQFRDPMELPHCTSLFLTSHQVLPWLTFLRNYTQDLHLDVRNLIFQRHFLIA